MVVPIFYSFALSQIFGLFMLIMAIVMLSKHESYRKMLSQLKVDNPVIFFSSTATLLLGIFLIETHNIWEWRWRVVVTIACWGIFIKAIGWLLIPETMLSIMKRIFTGNAYYWLIVIMTLLSFLFLGKGILLYIMASHG